MNEAKGRCKAVVFLAAVCLVLCCALVAGCAPQQAESDQSAGGEGGEPVVEVVWSMDSDCTTCHATEAASMSSEACLKSQDSSCVSCHADADALRSVHAGVEVGAAAPKKLKATEVADETCLACHSGTVEELAQTTEGAATLTDDMGTEVNPHRMMIEEQHADSGLTCSSCHKPHDGDLEKDAGKACASCHHAGVYECYTCHD